MNLNSRRALVWLSALVLLGLNDHILKYAGVLPPIITGKLSDFAGLVVAPALLVRLAHLFAPEASRRIQRPILFFALLLIAVPFSAINLVPTASQGLVLAMSRIGMSWMLWPDPTDLVALTVLPLSYWVSEVEAPAQRSVCDGVLLSMSATLCLATGAVPMDYSLGFLINLSTQPVNIRTATLQGEMDCTTYSPRLESGVLRSEDFITGGTAVLPPGEMVKLTGGEESSCRPVRLLVWKTDKEDEAVSVVVGFGRESRAMADPYRRKDLKDRTNIATITGSDGLKITLGPGLRTLELAEGPQLAPPAECAFPSYTTLSSGSDTVEITAVEQISERCTAYRGRLPSDSPAGQGGEGGVNGEGGANSGAGGLGGSTGALSHDLPETLTICTDHEISLGIGDVASVRSSGTSELDAALYEVSWGRGVRSIQQIESRSSYSSSTEAPTCAQVRHECGAVFVRTPPSRHWSTYSNRRFEAGWMTIVAKPGCPRELLQPQYYDRGVSIDDRP